MHSWRILLLPYLDQQALYEQYDFSKSWDSPENLRLAKQMPAVYSFHGSYEAGKTVTTNYLAVTDENSSWPLASASVEDLEPITEEVPGVLVAENQGAAVHWMEPRDFLVEDMKLEINAPEGISSKYDQPAVLLSDGTLRRLNAEVGPSELMNLLKGYGDKQSWTPLEDGRDRPEAKR